MNHKLTSISLGLLLTTLLIAPSCAPVKPVAEAEYSTEIVGSWQGTVEGKEESITFSEDGSFIAQLRSQGFIGNTLSEGSTGEISGMWTINGQTITVQISSEENERTINSVTSSTILRFNKNELTLKSDRGETSNFTRVISL